ncbi:MAG: polymer-forming cytoskeletal protein, partial [Bacteroidia bacterium]
ANGHINGDIYTQKLSVQVGATFTGNCRMGQEAKNMLSESQTRIEAENERRAAAANPKKNGINGHSGVEDKAPNVSLVNE